ncbi:flavin reductase [Nocardioides sp. CCNWLW239]|uniref:flavin reductase n=1 Tax=Nocardioides sp. CCNWLW239 TaxID=3128902 RepID=UPI00301A2B81
MTSSTGDARTDSKSRWRRVLGHYPTGITIITSVDETGSPVGMIVGTFTSVSEAPPLVGFLPMRSSWTYARIEKAGRFRASVLGAGHEQLCREFFSSAPAERFNGEGWVYDEHGLPRLEDAVAWFDCTIVDVLPAGDHAMVLGRVDDLGLGARSGGMPLLFLNGGYGSFTMPRMEFDIDDLGGRLRVATSVGDTVQELAEELGVACALSTVVRDEVVVLTAADIRSSYVGTCFPFAAPLDPGFGTWCAPELREHWLRQAERFGPVDRPLIERLTALVRQQGYAISFGHTMNGRFDSLVSSSTTDHSAMRELWVAQAAAYRQFCADPRPAVHAAAIQVPIFGADGRIAFNLVVGEFSPCEPERFRHIVATAVSYAARITEMTGGVAPDDYAPRLP